MGHNGHFGSLTVILVQNNGQFGQDFFKLTVILVCPKWPLFKKQKNNGYFVQNNGHFVRNNGHFSVK